MRFRLLGPLQAEPETPTAAKLRTVLATLLVGANTVVSTDSLIDELWNGAPPRTATTTLHVYISQLRKVLSPGPDAGDGRAVLETRPPGYVLHTGAGDVDLQRFDRLRARGEEAYSRQEFAQAGKALHEALGLWHGPALAGVVRGQRLEAAASRIDLLRMDALEQRIAADLWLGLHRRLTGELTGLVREYPLRETLHAHLMVALYRSNRQSEALTAYERIRRSLAQELGIDPGSALRELHQRMLRAERITHFDECLAGRPAVEVASVPSPVVRLPRPAVRLAGRDEQLDAAGRQLLGSDGTPPVAVLGITGAAGVGKSAFAVELAYRSAGHFPDGRVFVSLRSAQGAPLSAHAVLSRLLRLLRPGPDSPAPDPRAGVEELSDLLHVAAAGRRLLLVLDDASGADQIEPVALAATASTLVVTSRRPLAGLAASRTLPLPALTPDAAAELLRAHTGTPVADDTAAGIARLCGHSPLALRSAATALADRPHWSPEVLLTRLTDERSRLDVLALGDQDVRSRLLAGHQELHAAEQHAFTMLALAPRPDFAPWSAAALLGVPADDAERAMEGLLRAGLLTTRHDSGEPVRYVSDELSRALAGELLAQLPEEETRAATLRLCTGYRTLARHADALLSPGARAPQPDGEDTVPAGGGAVPAGGGGAVPAGGGGVPGSVAVPAGGVSGSVGVGHTAGAWPLRWFSAERTAVADAVHRAHDAGLWELAWTLADPFLRYLEAVGDWEAWESLSQPALTAARRAQDPAAEASVLCSQGALAWQRRQFTEAGTLYAWARTLARQTPDGRTGARALTGLADVELSRGEFVKAGRMYAKAALLCHAEGDLRGLADARRGQAFAALRGGRLDLALSSLEECARAAGTLGDRRWNAYARRAADSLRMGMAHGDPLELRPGVWEISEPLAQGAL